MRAQYDGKPVSIRRTHLTAFISAGITLFLAAAPLIVFLPGQANTLQNNQHWIVYKQELGADTMNEDAYFSDARALASGALNLGAWQGYQEVLFAEAVCPKRIKFDFKLGTGGYFYVEYDRTHDEPCHGFRISGQNSFPNAVVVMESDGRFLSRTPMHREIFTDRDWHVAEIEFDASGASLVVDGEAWQHTPGPIARSALVGFRGGAANVFIDNVEVVDVRRGTRLEEDFENYLSLVGQLWRPLLPAVLLSALALLLLRQRASTWTAALWNLTALHLCLAAATVPCAGFQRYIAPRLYPAASNALQQTEEQWVQDHFEQVASDIERRFHVAREPGRLRVMFVGTSQTHGFGATRLDEAFVNRLAVLLNEPGADLPDVECINTAVPAARSKFLLEKYESRWVDYAPDLTVVNLSINDDKSTDFEENLRRFAEINRAHGIKTLLVQEALSFEQRPEGLDTHEVVRAVGESMGVTVLNAREYLNEHKNKGVLWWDIVHPTSYGHGLIAECLFPPIRESLGDVVPPR